jgi:hypothetical protein
VQTQTTYSETQVDMTGWLNTKKLKKFQQDYDFLTIYLNKENPVYSTDFSILKTVLPTTTATEK